MVFAQMILVLICYTRNRKNASFIMRRVLLQTFPVIVLCVIIQRIYPDIMLNSLLISFMDTVLFLTFQGQRQGIHNLTRLNDRHRFFKDMESRILTKEKFQIFLINIKDFGMVNEKYGHLFGDEALYQFAYSLERLIKNSMAFHMNGTVFALAIPYTSQMDADENCSRVLGFLEEGIECKHIHLHFEHVIVEYLVDEKETDAAELYEKLEYAATLAYEKKHKYIRYTDDIGSQMHRTRYLIERLQTIDQNHGFSVWYQPIKCLSNEKFCSMEALIRLQEPDGTMISPAEFIPVAEQTGLINSVTWFVLDQVCRFISSHDEVKNIAVSVNLPMTQLLDKGFSTRLNSIVDHYHVEHRQICLEFTERAILENFEKTKDIMESLVTDGYRFYLDDFGTGYSNFNCLLQLPFQFIKLDRSLTRTDRNRNRHHDLVHTLTTLFHGMNLDVIAEGTETLEDVEAMISRGIDRVQGFYFARPMNEEMTLKFYHENPL
jgi:EAL domain-containing protein (putative c-di-GMP-specific phosphodiesterase class I)